jgi:hypothetical protein
MPTHEKQPILYGHLVYSVKKLILDQGRAIWPASGQGIPVECVPSSTDRGIFYLELPPRFVGRQPRLFQEWQIREICYQVCHKPTGQTSPIFDHEFKADPLKRVGGLKYLGPMKLFPAEQVWPELTRKGYYGELPQFFT